MGNSDRWEKSSAPGEVRSSGIGVTPPGVAYTRLIRIGKNVNRPNTSRLGPTNSQPSRDRTSQRWPARNRGPNRVKNEPRCGDTHLKYPYSFVLVPVSASQAPHRVVGPLSLTSNIVAQAL